MEPRYFLPSEIARLVLGYLKEENCMTTYKWLLKESSHLGEYSSLLKQGLEYPTTLSGKSLIGMLQEYAHLKLRDTGAVVNSQPSTTLWKQFDDLVYLIKHQVGQKQINAQSGVARRGRPRLSDKVLHITKPQANQTDSKPATDEHSPLTLETKGQSYLPSQDRFSTAECHRNSVTSLPPQIHSSRMKNVCVASTKCVTVCTPQKQGESMCVKGSPARIPASRTAFSWCKLSQKLNRDTVVTDSSTPSGSIIPAENQQTLQNDNTEEVRNSTENNINVNNDIASSHNSPEGACDTDVDSGDDGVINSVTANMMDISHTSEQNNQEDMQTNPTEPCDQIFTEPAPPVAKPSVSISGTSDAQVPSEESPKQVSLDGHHVQVDVCETVREQPKTPMSVPPPVSECDNAIDSFEQAKAMQSQSTGNQVSGASTVPLQHDLSKAFSSVGQLSGLGNITPVKQIPLGEDSLITPSKSIISLDTESTKGRSPRRKRFAPKRRSAGMVPLSGVGKSGPSRVVLPSGPARAAEGSGAEKTGQNEDSILSFTEDSMDLPGLVEEMLNNKNLQKRLAENINKGLHHSSGQTAQEPRPTAAEPLTPIKQPVTPMNSSIHSLEDILDLHETQMPEDAISNIIDLTRSDPAFDALFQLFDNGIGQDDSDKIHGDTSLSFSSEIKLMSEEEERRKETERSAQALIELSLATAFCTAQSSAHSYKGRGQGTMDSVLYSQAGGHRKIGSIKGFNQQIIGASHRTESITESYHDLDLQMIGSNQGHIQQVANGNHWNVFQKNMSVQQSHESTEQNHEAAKQNNESIWHNHESVHQIERDNEERIEVVNNAEWNNREGMSNYDINSGKETIEGNFHSFSHNDDKCNNNTYEKVDNCCDKVVNPQCQTSPQKSRKDNITTDSLSNEVADNLNLVRRMRYDNLSQKKSPCQDQSLGSQASSTQPVQEGKKSGKSTPHTSPVKSRTNKPKTGKNRPALPQDQRLKDSNTDPPNIQQSQREIPTSSLSSQNDVFTVFHIPETHSLDVVLSGTKQDCVSKVQNHKMTLKTSKIKRKVSAKCPVVDIKSKLSESSHLVSAVEMNDSKTLRSPKSRSKTQKAVKDKTKHPQLGVFELRNKQSHECGPLESLPDLAYEASVMREFEGQEHNTTASSDVQIVSVNGRAASVNPHLQNLSSGWPLHSSTPRVTRKKFVSGNQVGNVDSTVTSTKSQAIPSVETDVGTSGGSQVQRHAIKSRRSVVKKSDTAIYTDNDQCNVRAGNTASGSTASRPDSPTSSSHLNLGCNTSDESATPLKISQKSTSAISPGLSTLLQVAAASLPVKEELPVEQIVNTTILTAEGEMSGEFIITPIAGLGNLTVSPDFKYVQFPSGFVGPDQENRVLMSSLVNAAQEILSSNSNSADTRQASSPKSQFSVGQLVSQSVTQHQQPLAVSAVPSTTHSSSAKTVSDVSLVPSSVQSPLSTSTLSSMSVTNVQSVSTSTVSAVSTYALPSVLLPSVSSVSTSASNVSSVSTAAVSEVLLPSVSSVSTSASNVSSGSTCAVPSVLLSSVSSVSTSTSNVSSVSTAAVSQVLLPSVSPVSTSASAVSSAVAPAVSTVSPVNISRQGPVQVCPFNLSTRNSQGEIDSISASFQINTTTTTDCPLDLSSSAKKLVEQFHSASPITKPSFSGVVTRSMSGNKNRTNSSESNSTSDHQETHSAASASKYKTCSAKETPEKNTRVFKQNTPCRPLDVSSPYFRSPTDTLQPKQQTLRSQNLPTRTSSVVVVTPDKKIVTCAMPVGRLKRLDFGPNLPLGSTLQRTINPLKSAMNRRAVMQKKRQLGTVSTHVTTDTSVSSVKMVNRRLVKQTRKTQLPSPVPVRTAHQPGTPYVQLTPFTPLPPSVPVTPTTPLSGQAHVTSGGFLTQAVQTPVAPFKNFIVQTPCLQNNNSQTLQIINTGQAMNIKMPETLVSSGTAIQLPLILTGQLLSTEPLNLEARELKNKPSVNPDVAMSVGRGNETATSVCESVISTKEKLRRKLSRKKNGKTDSVVSEVGLKNLSVQQTTVAGEKTGSVTGNKTGSTVRHKQGLNTEHKHKLATDHRPGGGGDANSDLETIDWTQFNEDPSSRGNKNSDQKKLSRKRGVSQSESKQNRKESNMSKAKKTKMECDLTKVEIEKFLSMVHKT